MLFKKKTWKNRITEFPTRRMLTKTDGNTELVTVSRAEGNVSQEGDAFSEENMNDLENRILEAIGDGELPKELGTDIISAITTLNSNLSCTKEFSGSVTIAKSGTATITLPLESGCSYFLMIRGVDNVAWNGAYIIHTGKTSKTMVTLSATYNVTATLSNTTLTIKNGDVTYSQELAVELLKL